MGHCPSLFAAPVDCLVTRERPTSHTLPVHTQPASAQAPRPLGISPCRGVEEAMAGVLWPGHLLEKEGSHSDCVLLSHPLPLFPCCQEGTATAHQGWQAMWATSQVGPSTWRQKIGVHFLALLPSSCHLHQDLASLGLHFLLFLFFIKV